MKQITVFLENEKGRLSAVTRCLADAGINMQALTIAESAEYGLVRIICDKPEEALTALKVGDYRAIATDVVAIEVSNQAGGLAKLLETLDGLDLNIEYGYCFSTGQDTAIDVLKIKGAEAAVEAIQAAGFKVL
ncbi:MAG: amino acid-binding protein [Eggerthellales bacterium]|nr:amino acid-binding protein [Eggerthellales bacterium]